MQHLTLVMSHFKVAFLWIRLSWFKLKYCLSVYLYRHLPVCPVRYLCRYLHMLMMSCCCRWLKSYGLSNTVCYLVVFGVKGVIISIFLDPESYRILLTSTWLFWCHGRSSITDVKLKADSRALILSRLADVTSVVVSSDVAVISLLLFCFFVSANIYRRSPSSGQLSIWTSLPQVT